MFQLFIHPRTFFNKQRDEPEDLFMPFIIVILVSGFAFADVQLISTNFSSDVPHDIKNLLWRISLISSGIGSVGIIFTWAVISGAIAATAVVMWNKDCRFVKLLEAVGFAQIPLLISEIIIFVLLLLYPISGVPPELILSDAKTVESYLYNSTILGTTTHISSAMSIWFGVLLVFAVQSLFRLNLFQATMTVIIPYSIYKAMALLFAYL